MWWLIAISARLPSLVAPWLASPSPGASDPPAMGETGAMVETGRLLDRVVAMIGEDPVFLSDIERTLALGLVKPFDGEDREALERRVLAGLIDQRLRLRAVERYNLPPPPAAEIEAQLGELAERFGGRRALRDQLSELGLGDEDLRRLVERQLRILTYIDQRLRPRVFIEPEAIRAYYDDELVPAMDRRGESTPPLDQVEDDSRRLLRELRLDLEIERWTAELRDAVEVVDLYGRTEREPPPVVQTLGLER